MAILEVLSYPNDILRKKSSKVEKFDSKLHVLLDDMYETMMQRDGVGLAAVQVGVLQRVLLVNIPREEDGKQYKEDLYEIINPVILHKSDEIYWDEGCLSVPGFYEKVKRYKNISLGYQDRFGNERVLKAEGFLAVAFQHEMDHLEGILFIDKLSILKRKKFEKELKKAKIS
ncbi:peptide deformylase [Helicobacter anatolicus]|uniref:peptide deformylase n=1 Tax=Helicobacter anatolicus TaxID=2905874 RepID=UPI001E435357|nr:peptide deformylase [Helicobacter anatolicus]MCE3036287.1 peptide deformylase [Helicobacter anatolicus]MCE3039299.1 peptide deformylase [Helicobacter anatolicus]